MSRTIYLCMIASLLLPATSGFSAVEQKRSSRVPALSSTTLPETSSPLPAHTFTGKVERCLLEQYGDQVARVVTSLRLLEADYEHKEYVGEALDNLDSRDSRCFQECHSYVPGLKVQPFWNTKDFAWCQTLESKYKAIRKEFDAVTANKQGLQEAGNNIWAGALTQDASSYGEGWRTLVLMDRGRWDPVNVNLFPVTAQAVRDADVPAVEVFFASMQAETDIKPHTDNTNFVLTSHLAVDIPYSGENKCHLTIGDETRQWINGEVMLFDTSVIHDAVNESDKTRYILMLRVWHPDLTETEIKALQFTYDCLVLPDLVSNEPEKRLAAEQEAEALRTFPEIKRTIQGFGGGSKTSRKKPKKGAKKGFGS